MTVHHHHNKNVHNQVELCASRKVQCKLDPNSFIDRLLLKALPFNIMISIENFDGMKNSMVVKLFVQQFTSLLLSLSYFTIDTTSVLRENFQKNSGIGNEGTCRAISPPPPPENSN